MNPKHDLSHVPFPASEHKAVNAEPLSDSDVAARVRAVLELRGRMPLGQLQVHEEDGAIVLDGEVTQYYERQIALACAQHVPGVRQIVDRIRVRESPSRPLLDN